MQLKQFSKLLTKKSGLLKCIFLTLIFQILITGGIMYYLIQKTNENKEDKTIKKTILSYNKSHPLTSTFFIFIISICLILFMLLKDISFNMRFLMFFLFSIVQGILLGFATQFIRKEIIISAIISTFAIFSSFLTFGFLLTLLKIDLSWLGVFLFMGLLGLIIIQIVSIFIPENQKYYKYITSFGLILFSLFILYDTNNILLKYENKGIDCIRGALDYYLDVINIFLYSLNDR